MVRCCRGERTPGANEGRVSGASDIRTPTEIRSAGTAGGVALSVVLPGPAKSRIQSVLVNFQVEGALGNPEFPGHPRQVALASRDRRVDGVARDGIKIRNGRRPRGETARRSRSVRRAGDLLRKLCGRHGVIV